MNRLSTRVVLFFLLVVVILAGCSSAPSASNGSAADAANKPSAASSQPATAKDAAPAWPRTIKDAVGHDIVLQKKPERIAVLHPVYLDYFFALGEKPIASVTAAQAMKDFATLQPYAKSANLIDLGSGRDFNLELIAQTNPDVIVTFKGHIDAHYDNLSKIAPVVQIDFADSWQKATMICATIVGKEKLAEQYIQETVQLIGKTKEKLGPKMNQTFALLRIGGKGSFFAPGTNNTMYYKVDGFGMKPPKGYPADSQVMSLEALTELNPDYIIVQHDIALAQAAIKGLESSKVWGSLEAVKRNHVLLFDNSLNTASVLAVRLAAEKLAELKD
ncbi:MAG: ferrichrome transporter [Paenibacillus sp.]|jgi:iron complex transport system substrate-binding protein|nr:ferrichrome transporter [Paenibacillus sp.]